MTTTPFQIAIDAADAHRLNSFWSAAVGYEIEDHHDLITQLLDAGSVIDEDVLEHDGRLAFRTAAACHDPSGVAPRLWDGQQGPNRWVTMADPEGNEFCVA
jgi:hypothetical protein